MMLSLGWRATMVDNNPANQNDFFIAALLSVLMASAMAMVPAVIKSRREYDQSTQLWRRLPYLKGGFFNEICKKIRGVAGLRET